MFAVIDGAVNRDLNCVAANFQMLMHGYIKIKLLKGNKCILSISIVIIYLYFIIGPFQLGFRPDFGTETVLATSVRRETEEMCPCKFFLTHQWLLLPSTMVSFWRGFLNWEWVALLCEVPVLLGWLFQKGDAWGVFFGPVKTSVLGPSGFSPPSPPCCLTST